MGGIQIEELRTPRSGPPYIKDVKGIFAMFKGLNPGEGRNSTKSSTDEYVVYKRVEGDKKSYVRGFVKGTVEFPLFHATLTAAFDSHSDVVFIMITVKTEFTVPVLNFQMNVDLKVENMCNPGSSMVDTALTEYVWCTGTI